MMGTVAAIKALIRSRRPASTAADAVDDVAEPRQVIPADNKVERRQGAAVSLILQDYYS